MKKNIYEIKHLYLVKCKSFDIVVVDVSNVL